MLIAAVVQCATSVVADSSSSRGPEGGAETESGAVDSLAQRRQRSQSQSLEAGKRGTEGPSLGEVVEHGEKRVILYYVLCIVYCVREQEVR